jgi:hypothetical protein
VSQKRRNIINGTQGDLRLQPSFTLVAKNEEKNGRSAITKNGVQSGYRMRGSRGGLQKVQKKKQEP